MTEDIAVTSTSGAPEAEPVSLPNPIHTEPQNPEAGDKPAAPADKAAAPEKKPSIRDSIDRAAAKVAEKDTATATTTDKAKPLSSTEGAARDDKGKFAPKAADATAETAKPATDAAKPDATAAKPSATHNIAEPPARFSTDAKAAWATAPDPVKAEVHRAVKELEAGIKQHADNYAPFKEFHDLAKSVNVDAAKALREYVNIDKMLGENFDAGLQRIFQNKGVDPRQWAAKVLGQQAPAQQPGAQQQQAQPNAEVVQLRQHIARLEQQIGGVSTHIQAQQTQTVEQEIAAFRSHPDHALFDELSTDIAAHIKNNGLSLQDAYDKAVAEAQDKARRLGFIAQPAAAPAPPPVEAQTLRAGLKSIAGAPSAGSAPATHKPSSSIKESIRRAMQQVA